PLPASGMLVGIAVWKYCEAKGLRYYTVAMSAVAAVAWLCSAFWYHDVGGLAYLRTGWSGSLAYASVIALVLMGLSSSVRSVALWGGCYAVIASSQLYLGGRAGLLSPVVAYLIILMAGFLGPRIRNGAIILAIFAAVVLAPSSIGVAKSVIVAT